MLESCLHKAITIHAVDAGVHCRYSPRSGGSHGEPHDASLKGPLEVPASCLLVKAGLISKLDHFVHGLEQTSFENPEEKNIPA